MAGFNDLGDAGASQDADQVAIVRGGSTLRQAVGRILSGIAGRIGSNELAAATARADSPEHRREWLERLGAAALAGAVSYNTNTIIPGTADGWLYRATGATTRLLSLPNASGAGEVHDRFSVIAANGSTADQQISPNGADTIGPNAGLTLEPGRAVQLVKVATGQWIVVADTKDETGSAMAFAPTKENLYAAVKAIFGHNTAVTADDEDSELDFATGAAGALDDDSIAAIKARASDAGGKKAWRLRIGAWHLDVTDSSILPAVANYNPPDGVLLGQSGDTSVSFADISDRSTALTAGVAGDLMLLLGRGWVRVGNLFTGGAAVAAVREAAEAAQLEADTVIQAGPEFVHNERAARNLNVHVRHPLNAYSTARLMSVAVSGQPPVYVEYDHTVLEQWVDAEVGATVLQNIWDQTVSTGTPPRPQLYRVGTYIPVEIRLLTGRNGDTVFIRVMDVLVVAPSSVPRTFTQKSATPGAARTWTYPLAAEDTEIMFAAEFNPSGGTTNVGSHNVVWPRSYFSQARHIIIESRNPGASDVPDGQELGCVASIAGNTLTCVTTGFEGDWTSAPLIWSK